MTKVLSAHGAFARTGIHPAAAGSRDRFGEFRLVAYAAGNFGKNLVFSGADLTFLFILTELLGLSASRAASLMLAALAGDLVFDLVAAKLVIALRRFGHGYRWLIIAGAMPCGIAFALVYSVAALRLLNPWVLALTLMVFRGAYAVIDVPHNALMAQVTPDSSARGRVSGYRRFFSTAASLCVAAVLAPQVQAAAHTHRFAVLSAAGITAGAVFAVTIMGAAILSRSDGQDARTDAVRGDGIAVPVSDPLLIAMAAIGILTGLAVPAFERMLLYLGTYVFQTPASVPALLSVLSAGQFIGVFGWTWLTRSVSSPRLLALGHAMCVLSLAVLYFSRGSHAGMIACVLVLGIGQTCVFMLPWGMLADIVDMLEWRHDRRYEAGVFAFFLVVVKVSGAACSVLIGYVLDWAGYVPQVAQNATTKAAMLGLGLGLPLVGGLLACMVAANLRIDHRCHARIVAALARRNSLHQAAAATINPRVPNRSQG